MAGRAEAMALIAKKDALEAEVEAILARLNGGADAPGVEGNLLTADGFPRADIDVYAVRLDRNRLHMLRNDLKAVNDALAGALAGAFGGEAAPNSGGGVTEVNGGDAEHVLPERMRRARPIAVVGQVRAAGRFSAGGGARNSARSFGECTGAPGGRFSNGREIAEGVSRG